MRAESKLKRYTPGRNQQDFAHEMTLLYGIEILDFRFDTEEHILITFPNHTHQRSAYLRSLIRTPNPLIVDAFACIGADTMALMADFPRAQMFAVQRTGSDKELERFQRLTHNTALFNQTFYGGRCALVTVPLKIEKFLSNVRRQIDLLYLDPPWGDDTGTPHPDQTVIDYAASVLALAQPPPKVVVMKLRPAIRDKLNGYTLARSLEIKAYRSNSVLYYFHVFVVDTKRINDPVLEKNACSCQSPPSAPHPTIPCASGPPKACEVQHSDAEMEAGIACLVLPIDSAGMSC